MTKTIVEDEKIESKIKDMLAVGAHFGYSSSRMHPKMKPFIFTTRNNVEIFDLEKTLLKLETIKEFLKGLGVGKKTILFVGTKKEVKEPVEKTAKELNALYVTERWLGGALTNFSEIKKRIDYLNDLSQKKISGELEKYTKKERLQIEKNILKMRNYLGGLEQMKNLPSAVIVIDPVKEKVAVAEARKMKIPVVALMGNDCDPGAADYPMPANVSSLSSINYFLSEIAGAYKDGLSEEKKEEKIKDDKENI